MLRFRRLQYEVSKDLSGRWRISFAGQGATVAYSRRQFLKAGALGVGLSPGPLFFARAAAAPSDTSSSSFGAARHCIFLFLTGGAPQHDTWDPKPDAPSQIRGSLGTIATRIPGLFFSELCPMTAAVADRLCVVRSVTHADRTHTSAGYTMLTGVPHPQSNAKSATDIGPKRSDHPHLGSVLSAVRRDGLAPPFVALPEVIRDAGVNTFPGQDGGFLGTRRDPVLIERATREEELSVPGLALSDGLPFDRIVGRRELLKRIEGRRSSGGVGVDHWDSWRAKAFDLLGAPAMREAMDLDRETAGSRARYGTHLFGRGCLLARRLVEAGVGLVSVYWSYDGPDDSPVWDTHQNNEKHLRERLVPPTDRALSALIADLDERGLLDETLVVCCGEFGRTPRINALAGRDHWPSVASVVLAGAGIRSGAAFGSSDSDGAFPWNNAVTPAELFATLTHLLGIPPDLELKDPFGRIHRAAVAAPIVGILNGR